MNFISIPMLPCQHLLLCAWFWLSSSAGVGRPRSCASHAGTQDQPSCYKLSYTGTDQLICGLLRAGRKGEFFLQRRHCMSLPQWNAHSVWEPVHTGIDSCHITSHFQQLSISDCGNGGSVARDAFLLVLHKITLHSCCCSVCSAHAIVCFNRTCGVWGNNTVQSKPNTASVIYTTTKEIIGKMLACVWWAL